MSAKVGRAIGRALGRSVGVFPGLIDVSAVSVEDWASVTLAGARHRLRLVLEGEGAVGAAADFLARMDRIEFQIPGHIVADLSLLAEERRDGGDYVGLDLEALTIAE